MQAQRHLECFWRLDFHAGKRPLHSQYHFRKYKTFGSDPVLPKTIVAQSRVSAELSSQTYDFMTEALAPGTRRLYAGRWRLFVAWCDRHHTTALPADPAQVANYLSELAGRGSSVSTIAGHRLAISTAHAIAKFASPTEDEVVKLTMKGIRRKLGTRPNPKTALHTRQIREMMRAMPDDLLGTRDAALLLIGFAGALRRSEIVALNVGDVEFVHEGLKVLIRRSKEDQEGAGQQIAIPYGSHPETCPVRNLQEWLRKAGIADGALFRPLGKEQQVQDGRLCARSVALIVKRSAKRIGLDPKSVAGHSLRSGFATSAAEHGILERHIMRQTRHKSVMMLRRYIQEGELFRDNPAAGIGL